MFVVRFVALTALAIWVGGMATAIFRASGAPGDFGRPMHVLGFTCGGLILVSLFVLKFVGPPPRRFPLRAGTVVLMLLIELSADALQVASMTPTAINLALALGLLSWYARE